MSSLFIFRRDGTFLDEINEGSDLSKYPVLRGVEIRQPSLLREKQEKTPGGTHYVLYRKPQEPDSPRYFEALAQELERREFVVYLYEEAKSKIAHLLISAQLKNKDVFKFFDMLVAAAPSELAQLERGIKEDLAVS